MNFTSKALQKPNPQLPSTLHGLATMRKAAGRRETMFDSHCQKR